MRNAQIKPINPIGNCGKFPVDICAGRCYNTTHKRTNLPGKRVVQKGGKNDDADHDVYRTVLYHGFALSNAPYAMLPGMIIRSIDAGGRSHPAFLGKG